MCECRLPGRALRIEIIILTLDSAMLGILQKGKIKNKKQGGNLEWVTNAKFLGKEENNLV